MNQDIKVIIIANIVARADEPNKLWMYNYLSKNIDDIVESVNQHNPLKHGFRGLEVQDEMRRLGE
jgi:hypothetical protein